MIRMIRAVPFTVVQLCRHSAISKRTLSYADVRACFNAMLVMDIVCDVNAASRLRVFDCVPLGLLALLALLVGKKHPAQLGPRTLVNANTLGVAYCGIQLRTAPRFRVFDRHKAMAWYSRCCHVDRAARHQFHHTAISLRLMLGLSNMAAIAVFFMILRSGFNTRKRFRGSLLTPQGNDRLGV